MASSSPPSATAGTSAIAERLSNRVKWAYGAGASSNILGHWLYLTLADPVFNSYFHLTPSQIGWVKGIALAVDACAGLLFGWLSDNTRTRWGRRRPFILVGSMLSGFLLPLLFLPTREWSQDKIYWYMLFSAALYAPIIASYNSAFQALGSEMTPNTIERTQVMGVKATVEKCVGSLMMGGLWFAQRPFFDNVAQGAMAACAVAGMLMVGTGATTAVLVPERYYGAVTSKQSSVGFGEMVRRTFSCKPFLILLGVAFCFAVPTAATTTLGYYAGTYYALEGDLNAWGEISFFGGIAYAVFGVAGIYPASKLAEAAGKRVALMAVIAVGLVVFGLSWVMYVPGKPWLMVVHTGLNGLCATGLWVLLPSMTIDTIDYDEEHSGQRREGGFSSSFAWTMKAGMVSAQMIAGSAIDAFTDFDPTLGAKQSADTMMVLRLLFAGIPVVACVLALAILSRFPLTTERMIEIRAVLEARRGKV